MKQKCSKIIPLIVAIVLLVTSIVVPSGNEQFAWNKDTSVSALEDNGENVAESSEISGGGGDFL